MSWICGGGNGSGAYGLTMVKTNAHAKANKQPRSRITAPLFPLPIEIERVTLGFRISRGFGGTIPTYTTTTGATALVAINELLKTRSLSEDSDGNQTFTRSYIITGTRDPLACRSLGPQMATQHETAPDFYVASRKYRVMSHAENEYSAIQLDVEYQQAARPDLGGGDTDAGFGYEFTSESEHVDLAIAQTGYGANPRAGNQVNVTQDSVDGVDVASPVVELTEEHTFSESRFTPTFRRTLMETIGKVNSAPFREWEAGEVLLQGASARKINKRWHVSFSFRVRRNRTITASLMGPDGNFSSHSIPKLGWAYYWVQVGNGYGNGNTTSAPIAAYTAQVYETADFAVLGFRVSPLP